MGGDGSGRVECVKGGKFGRVGGTSGRESWVGMVANNAETVAERVARWAGSKWFRCRRRSGSTCSSAKGQACWHYEFCRRQPYA